jgi:hypothetical protein
VRGSEHSKDIRFDDITCAGCTLGDALKGYENVLSGQAIKT